MTKENSVGLVETQYFTFAEPPHEMVLESGSKLGPITLAYETYGVLNEERSNAILVTHALTGDAHAAGRHQAEDRKAGWWDTMIGPGKAFDTDKYFILCSNVIGGCMGSTGPASINPETGTPYGLDFPVITVGDMVRAQYELVQHFGIEQLLCVAGGSMGGMQVLDWATRYPDKVRSSIIVSSSHFNGAQQIAFHAVGRNAIQSDSAFNNGQYHQGPKPTQGLAIARMLGHITYLSDESMRMKFGRSLRYTDDFNYDFENEFAVETYLDYQGEQFVNRFDANSYLYVSKAVDYFDISRTYGSLDDAMARIQGKTLIISFSSDWLYPPYQSEEMVYSLMRKNKDVSYCQVESDYGHDAFLLEIDTMEKLVSGFLRHTQYPDRPCETCESEKGNGSKPHFGGPPATSADSIYRGKRIDYDTIVDLVEPGSRVLDIGCGKGELLCRLKRLKNVQGLGLELREKNVIQAIKCGIPIIHSDIGHGLAGLPDQSFDYVLLSMTLQVLKKPAPALREMVRVGKKCIVSFPNFALWRVRVKALLTGHAPITRNLPYAWYQSPNRHALSMKDFRLFCQQLNLKIEREIPLTSKGVTHFWPNLFAEEALYVISDADNAE